MKWILWVIAVTANGNDIVIDKSEFGSASSCNAAAVAVTKVNETPIGSNARLEALCLEREP